MLTIKVHRASIGVYLNRVQTDREVIGIYNEEILRARIKESGLKLDHIEKQLGLSDNGFRNKLYGRTDFTTSEAAKLAEVLRLTSDDLEQIFFS